MKEKPINIIMEEVKEELNENITTILKKHKINFYLLEIIIKELYDNINLMKHQELEQTRNSLKTKNNGKEE